MNKELIINNMKEIIRAVPNTYAAYVANVTLKHVEEIPKLTSIPMKEISMVLDNVMDIAVANGANSISMPDEYVAIAHFLCYPQEYSMENF